MLHKGEPMSRIDRLNHPSSELWCFSSKRHTNQSPFTLSLRVRQNVEREIQGHLLAVGNEAPQMSERVNVANHSYFHRAQVMFYLLKLLQKCIQHFQT